VRNDLHVPRSSAMPQTFNVGARSRFVTFVAWLFIALSVFACAWAVIQNATQSSWAAELATHRALPGLGGVLVRQLPWLLSTAAALSLATGLCAFGLLRRLEWARRLFIGLLGLAIMVDLAGLWLQQEMVHLLVESALRDAPLPRGAADLLGGAVTTARVLAGLLTLGASLALAGIIRRLMSPSVRQEFA
jgi:hypothetical protein